jgi:hypothetical protein
MTDLKDALRDGDPMAHEDGLVEAEAAAMKRAILAAAGDTQGRPLIWNALLVAIPVVIMLAIGTTLRESLMTAVQQRTPTTSAVSGVSGARQLYFQTEGGTRVIWIFTPEEPK